MSVIGVTKPPAYISVNQPEFMIRISYWPEAARTELRCFSSEPANGFTSSSTRFPVSASYCSTVRRKLSNQGDWLMTMVIGAADCAQSGRHDVESAAAPIPASACRRLIRNVPVILSSHDGTTIVGDDFTRMPFTQITKMPTSMPKRNG